jgi:hypothetical protein
MKKLLPKLLVALAASVLALAAGELLARRVYYPAPVRELGARALWLRYSGMYTEEVQDNGCTYSDEVVPHPYLMYVHKHDFTGCGPDLTQRLGMQSRYPYPMERDPEHFSVLILGGSVAHLLGIGSWRDGRIWLEDALNAGYRSPNGKPFRVFSGAEGGWLLPIQNNVITLAGDSFDAYIAVDGFNEALNTKLGMSIDRVPAPMYAFLVDPADAPPGLKALWWLKTYRRFCFRSGLARRSFLAYLFFEKGIALMSRDKAYRKFLEERVGWYFRLPEEWDKAKRDAWNRRKYETYIKLQAAQAHAVDALYAHFVQPIHEIGKPLSEDEKRLPSLIAAQDYRDVMMPASEDLRGKGFPSFLLTDVFKDSKETLYSDHIHCRVTPQGDSPGYELISKRIAALLGEAWHLKKIRPSSGARR